VDFFGGELYLFGPVKFLSDLGGGFHGELLN